MIRMIGASQNFLRTLRNCHNSVTNSIAWYSVAYTARVV
jgi:hypothetical protein